MYRTLHLIVCSLVVACAGCGPSISDPTPSGLAMDAPWHNTEEIGSVSSLLGPTIKISSTKGMLFTILETTANHFKVTISVEPSFLLDKPITVELEGDNAEKVLNALAKASRLELTKLADDKWQLVYPSLRDGKVETVKQSDY